MYSGYKLIDKDFLCQFTDKEQSEIKKIIHSYYLRCRSGRKIGKRLSVDDYFESSSVRYKFLLSYCPRCKKIFVIVTKHKKSIIESFKYCGYCGEADVNYRYTVGYDKVERTILLSWAIKKLDLPMSSADLNQQAIAIMVSVFEVFLRDCYAGIMNTRFVGLNNTLFNKFVENSKNDFLNPGKANQRYQKDLGISLKSLFKEGHFSRLEEISEYRNVIVHNNGIVDNRFLNAKIGSYRLHENIAIDIRLVQDFMKVIDQSVKAIGEVYSKVINQAIVDEVKLRLAINPTMALPLSNRSARSKTSKDDEDILVIN